MILETENKIYHFIRALRPRQWIKNGFVFAPLVFSKQLFIPGLFTKSLSAFILFSIAASSIYLVNDCLDYEKDKLHPVKKNRPIASGRISPWLALVAACIMLFFVIVSSFFLNLHFGYAILAYLTLQIAYNIKLKEVIILDALVITIGFIVRLYAGAFATQLPISSWLVLSVIGVSLLLAFGKRRAERTLLAAKGISSEKTRAILEYYPNNLLNSMISMSASYAIISYSLFAFNDSPRIILAFDSNSILEGVIPQTLTDIKWLMITIPIVIYSVARYLFIIYEKNEGESPDRVILNDKPFFFSVIIWMMTILAIYYYENSIGLIISA